jgi:prevent-host-death family protein
MDDWLVDGYILGTGQYSVADAKNHLSDLINRAIAGESVVITRHGHPVVELKAVRPEVRRVTREDLDWLASRRVGMNSKWMPGPWSVGCVTKTNGEAVSRCERDRCAADERHLCVAGRCLGTSSHGK